MKLTEYVLVTRKRVNEIHHTEAEYQNKIAKLKLWLALTVFAIIVTFVVIGVMASMGALCTA